MAIPFAAWRAILTLLGLGFGVVLVAFLVGKVQPKKRRRLKQAVVLFALHLASLVAIEAFGLAHFESAAQTAVLLAELTRVLLLINLGFIAFFDVALPTVRMQLPGIVTDVAIGVAYVVAVIHELHNAGVSLSGLIATSAVVSGVLGLSLAPTIGNILGGFALQLDDSIHEGDWIQLDEKTQGQVKEIRWRHTVVETRNWDTIIVPNANLLSAHITILGKRADQPLQRRYWVYFNVDYRFAPEEVIQVVNEALACGGIENVAAEPKPHAICFDFARDGKDSFAYYAVRYWLTDLGRDDPTNSRVRERIYAALKRAGIPLALPGTAVFVSHDDPAHEERKAAREKVRRLALLKSVELFKTFTPEELDHLVERLRSAPFAAGEVMTHQGRAAHYLYILAKGEAEVVVDVAGVKKHVARITAPDVFGEAGMMTGQVREASVIALTASECFRLDKEAFQEILQQRGELAEQMSLVMARRRTEMRAAVDGDEKKERRVADEHAKMIRQIQEFFGLADERRRR